MTLGERIGIKRKESGLSQEKLGELFNVSRQTVYKWEANLAVPELDKLKGMAELFGVSLDYLINGKEEKKQLKTETNPKIRKLFITAVLLLIGISVFLLISLNGLKNDYLNLKNSVDNMNVYVNNRINSIVRSLENTMSTYSSLSVDYAVEAIKADQD
ncbi:MAG: helix-turn-helix transcriptional regulator, partial [Solobacterium sp.]|nr:helix-turn-helix transcriptional regulator [Solobacterium sp.]